MCVSIRDEGFNVAVPKLISLFVCLVGPCSWMIKDLDWSVWRGEEQKEESEEKSSREKQESGACTKMRMEKKREGRMSP